MESFSITRLLNSIPVSSAGRRSNKVVVLEWQDAKISSRGTSIFTRKQFWVEKYQIFPDSLSNSQKWPQIVCYADVLLLKAEAILKSGGSKSDAIAAINEVRARARNGGTVPADFPTAETDETTIMQWIMDERLRELAGEGQRWFDLRRWNMAGYITLDNAFFGSLNPGDMEFDAKYLYFPIPLTETSRNVNIVQNPGY